MSSGLSPVIANMVMEDLEQVLNIFHSPPSVWVQYANVIYAIIKI